MPIKQGLNANEMIQQFDELLDVTMSNLQRKINDTQNRPELYDDRVLLIKRLNLLKELKNSKTTRLEKTADDSIIVMPIMDPCTEKLIELEKSLKSTMGTKDKTHSLEIDPTKTKTEEKKLEMTMADLKRMRNQLIELQKTQAADSEYDLALDAPTSNLTLTEEQKEKDEISALDSYSKNERLGVNSMEKVNKILTEALFRSNLNDANLTPGENHCYSSNAKSKSGKNIDIQVIFNASKKIFVRVTPYYNDTDNQTLINKAVEEAFDKEYKITPPKNDDIKKTTQYDSHYPLPTKYGYLSKKNGYLGSNIPVQLVMNEDKKIIVRVGPYDLSGVGGHDVRRAIIKDAVNYALTNAGMKSETGAPITFDDVNVAAQISVRGRAQMIPDKVLKLIQGIINRFIPFLTPFNYYLKEREITNKFVAGTHQNAYVKMAHETVLDHWEPRTKKGPQGFFNDTICAMVSIGSTHLFENKVMSQHPPLSTQDAKKEILLSKPFKKIFDHVLHAEPYKKVSAFITKLQDLNKKSRAPNESPPETPSVTPKSRP
jgi:hypothetical protein